MRGSRCLLRLVSKASSAVTCSTSDGALGVDISVLRCVLVAVGAVSGARALRVIDCPAFQAPALYRTTKVLSVRYWFYVFRVYAASVIARVVRLKTFTHRAVEELPDELVGSNSNLLPIAASFENELSIAAGLALTAIPFPTSAWVNSDKRKETFNRWFSWVWSQVHSADTLSRYVKPLISSAYANRLIRPIMFGHDLSGINELRRRNRNGCVITENPRDVVVADLELNTLNEALKIMSCASLVPCCHAVW